MKKECEKRLHEGLRNRGREKLYDDIENSVIDVEPDEIVEVNIDDLVDEEQILLDDEND